MALTPELVAQEVPPHWLCYFGVDNCDAATADAQRLGAAILRPAAGALPAAAVDLVGTLAVFTAPDLLAGAAAVLPAATSLDPDFLATEGGFLASVAAWTGAPSP